MNVLITGSGGALGQRLCTILRRRGHVVLATGRERRGNVCAVWNVAIEEGPHPPFPVDAVIHAAARLGRWGEPLASAERLRQVNVDGSLRVARWCADRGVPRMIYLSTASVYGECAEPAKETELPRPHEAGAYAVSKHCGEQVARLAEAAGVEVTVLRLSSLFGPEYRDSLIVRMMRQVMQTGEIRIDPPEDDAFDLLDAGDAARTIARSIEVGGGGLFNVGSGRLTTLGQLARLCAAAADGRVRISAGPATRPRRILGWVDDALARRELGHKSPGSIASFASELAAAARRTTHNGNRAA